MSDLFQDVRYGWRQLFKSPAFTLAACACIALGIGANTATFTFANAFLFRKSPHVQEPERLVRLFISWASGLKLGSFSYPDYEDFRDRNDVFTGLAVEALAPLHLSSGDRNERIWGSVVSGNYFAVLGVNVTQGRSFLPEEDVRSGGQPVVVLSHGLWKRRFGSDPSIVGTTVTLNGHPFTVVGVAPEGFVGPNVGLGPELWAPFAMTPRLMLGRTLTERGNHWIGSVIGRMKSDVTAAQVRESTNALMVGLVKEYPQTNEGKSVDVYTEDGASLHPMVRRGFVRFLRLMFGVVGFILLLACANVAGLLLARAVSRRREIAVRMALGGSRSRIIRQLLVENAMLSALACGAGLLLGLWLTRLIGSFRPSSDLPLVIDASLDSRVLAFTFIVTILSALVFGLAPALQTTRADLVSALKEGGPQGGPGGKSSRLRRLLVVTQVALSAILLVGAALTVRSLSNVRNLDPGFNPLSQLVGTIDLDLQGYDEAKSREFQENLRARLGALPGVAAVGLSRQLPLQLSSSQNGALPEGNVFPPDKTPSIDYNVVDPGYFAAMGVTMLRGRTFDATDTPSAPPVLVVNQQFADRFWPGQDPVGKHVRTSGKEHTVIGIVENGKYVSLGEDPKAFMYYSLLQRHDGSTVLHVRTAAEPTALMTAVRNEIRSLDPLLPVSDLKSMERALGFALLPARLAAGVVSAFAVLALFLAAGGLYGVMSYAVSENTREIGIRMALGARAGDVEKQVLRQGLVLTGFGVATGLLGGFVLTRVMAGLLYGVSATDPVSFVTGALVIVAAAALASYIPARRATRVDPIPALRVP